MKEKEVEKFANKYLGPLSRDILGKVLICYF